MAAAAAPPATYVWFAFLCREDDADDNGADAMHDDARATCCASLTDELTLACMRGREMHAQPLFWDEELGSYVSFCACMKEGRVHRQTIKRFARNWSFVRMRIAAGAAARMRAFLEAQVGRPFSACAAYSSWCCPAASNGRAWFCSQLCAAALRAAGLVPATLEPGAVSPSRLHALLFERARVLGFECTESHHPVRHALFWSAVDAAVSAPRSSAAAPPSTGMFRYD